jgi:hypothetical protein
MVAAISNLLSGVKGVGVRASWTTLRHCAGGADHDEVAALQDSQLQAEAFEPAEERAAVVAETLGGNLVDDLDKAAEVGRRVEGLRHCEQLQVLVGADDDVVQGLQARGSVLVALLAEVARDDLEDRGVGGLAAAGVVDDDAVADGGQAHEVAARGDLAAWFGLG